MYLETTHNVIRRNKKRIESMLGIKVELVIVNTEPVLEFGSANVSYVLPPKVFINPSAMLLYLYEVNNYTLPPPKQFATLVCNTLAHEMRHVWQWKIGKLNAKAYMTIDDYLSSWEEVDARHFAIKYASIYAKTPRLPKKPALSSEDIDIYKGLIAYHNSLAAEGEDIPKPLKDIKRNIARLITENAISKFERGGKSIVYPELVA